MYLSVNLQDYATVKSSSMEGICTLQDRIESGIPRTRNVGKEGIFSAKRLATCKQDRGGNWCFLIVLLGF